MSVTRGPWRWQALDQVPEMNQGKPVFSPAISVGSLESLRVWDVK